MRRRDTETLRGDIHEAVKSQAKGVLGLILKAFIGVIVKAVLSVLKERGWVDLPDDRA
jgi:hypothetical protein